MRTSVTLWNEKYVYIQNEWGFPGSSVVKNPPGNAGDMGVVPGSVRSPSGRKWQPTSVFLPGKSHDRD